jgi:hypothetical protein
MKVPRLQVEETKITNAGNGMLARRNLMEEKKSKIQPNPRRAAAAPEAPATSPVAETREQKITRLKDEAMIARDLLIPGALSAILGSKLVSHLGVKIYVNTFYRDNGCPTDPVEIMMLEQLLLAHHRLAQLHVRATEVTSPDLLKIINTAVTDLMGEFRRLSLAIRIYRKPPSPKSFNVVHQQNLVTGGGGQEVHYVDESASEQEKVSFGVRSKQEGKPEQGAKDDSRVDGSRASQEPTPGSRRAGQRLQAAGLDD